MRLISNEELMVVSGGCAFCIIIDVIDSVFRRETPPEETPDQTITISARRMTDAEKAAFDAMDICRAYSAAGLTGVEIEQGSRSIDGTVTTEVGPDVAKIGGSLTVNGEKVSVKSTCPAP